MAILKSIYAMDPDLDKPGAAKTGKLVILATTAWDFKICFTARVLMLVTVCCDSIAEPDDDDVLRCSHCGDKLAVSATQADASVPWSRLDSSVTLNWLSAYSEPLLTVLDATALVEELEQARRRYFELEA